MRRNLARMLGGSALLQARSSFAEDLASFSLVEVDEGTWELAATIACGPEEIVPSLCGTPFGPGRFVPKVLVMGETSTEARDIAAILSFSVLRYVERAVGKAEARRVRIAAGETRSMGELLERGAWSSVGVLLAIAEQAAALTGDLEIGRRSGEELFRFMREVGFTDRHRAMGSIDAALEQVILSSSRASTGRVMTVVDRSATTLLVESRSRGPLSKDRFFCDYSAGYWSSIPNAFDTTGYAVELECLSRGDERCLTQVSWLPPATAVDIETSSARANQMLVRHEELQQMAADLFAAEDVDVVLDLVVQRAGLAVLAPRFLLAVQMPDSPEVRVRHVGFRDDESARRAADAVLAGRQSSSTLVVDVASKRQHYGCFAALYPKDTESSGVDRRMMSSYATHVAAALEATSAYEQARRDRDTAQALLGLSSSLAGVVTVPDLSQRLADAIAVIGDGCRGAFFLFDAASDRLDFAACDASAASAGTPWGLVRAIEGVSGLLGAGGPVILDVEEVTGELRELMASTDIRYSVAIPIVARGDLLGLVSASFDRRIGGDEQRLLVARLSGLADQAATSLDNVRLLERTSYQATHDELTGLPNRAMLEDRANQALAIGRRNGNLSALLFVDLDRFKSVNDTLGHHAGDDLIRQVAERLAGVVRETDTLARLGGDEFVVLLSAVADEVAAVRVAQRIVEDLARSYTVADEEVFVSASVGIAVSAVDCTDYQTLLQRADAAMYDVKAAGRNACATHAASTDRTEVKRLSIETALHSALAKGELSVAYQPQVDLRSGAIIGAEALVRWHHPNLGSIAPDVFVPVAEEAGLMAAIDRWVRCTTLAEVRRWRETTHPSFRISFNLSTRELRDPELPSQLVRDLAAAGVPPGAVELEITERVVMADNEDLVGILHALHATGVRLAIDDFGTGSAVLGRLQRHPVDTLKIDRSFIGEITSVSSAAVVSALLQMGGVLGIDVIAEGVETETQRAVLTELGCPFAQGYLFCRPVPADELGEVLRSSVPPLGAMAVAAG